MPHAPRPLAVTADPDVLDDLLRLAATAGVELDVAPDAATARRSWAAAPFVVVGVDALRSCLRAGLPRRSGVALLGTDLDDAGVWQRAVELGAEHVVFLPDAETWLVDRFADAGEDAGPAGALVAVVGGRGGAGATTLACALAVTATRAGRPTLLVDGDPLGGGIDLVFGGEEDRGVRWPDLGATRGRVPAAALTGALPRMAGLSVLSWDRGDAGGVPVEAVRAVLSPAAARTSWSSSTCPARSTTAAARSSPRRPPSCSSSRTRSAPPRPPRASPPRSACSPATCASSPAARRPPA